MAMARHIACGLCIATLAAALTLQGCGKVSTVSLDHQASPPGARTTMPERPAAAAEPNRRSKTGERSPVPTASSLLNAAEDPRLWMEQLLHAPDPNVRIQGLDAWARQPGASLDPATYALVDPDESVRARAQEVLERELARR